MAKTKISCLVLLALIAISMLATEVNGTDWNYIKQKYGDGSLKPEQCNDKCSYRCKLSGHHKQCMFYCQKCCAKCLCVPPGTHDLRWVCDCYNNWKTQEGTHKCP